MRRLAVYRIEIQSLARAAEGAHQLAHGIELAVWDRNSVSNGRRGQKLPLLEHPPQPFGVHAFELPGEVQRQLGEHPGLGVRHEVGDDELRPEEIRDFHGPARLGAS